MGPRHHYSPAPTSSLGPSRCLEKNRSEDQDQSWIMIRSRMIVNTNLFQEGQLHRGGCCIGSPARHCPDTATPNPPGNDHHPMVILWWSCNDPMMILWWFYNDPIMILWWSYNDPIMILWWWKLTVPSPPQTRILYFSILRKTWRPGRCHWSYDTENTPSS